MATKEEKIAYKTDNYIKLHCTCTVCLNLFKLTMLKTLCRPQCNMAVYYCFSAPQQVTNTFPEVAFKISCLFGLPTSSFCSFIAPRHIRLKWPNVTYIGDQEARYCNRKVQVFPEITDLWAKSLTVYLICAWLIWDKGTKPEKNIGLHRLTRITQINKDYTD